MAEGTTLLDKLKNASGEDLILTVQLYLILNIMENFYSNWRNHTFETNEILKTLLVIGFLFTMSLLTVIVKKYNIRKEHEGEMKYDELRTRIDAYNKLLDGLSHIYDIYMEEIKGKIAYMWSVVTSIVLDETIDKKTRVEKLGEHNAQIDELFAKLHVLQMDLREKQKLLWEKGIEKVNELALDIYKEPPTTETIPNIKAEETTDDDKQGQ